MRMQILIISMALQSCKYPLYGTNVVILVRVQTVVSRMRVQTVSTLMREQRYITQL